MDPKNYDTMSKMELVSETAKQFGIGRNDCLKFTVDSMKAALKGQNAELLAKGDGSPVQVVQAKAGLGEALGQLGTLIETAIDGRLAGFKPESAVDASKVKAMIAEEFGKLTMPTLVEVKREDGKVVKVGVAHKRFPEVAHYLGRGKNVWVYGPAGSGKTEGALAYAEATGTKFALVACHRDLSPGRVVGSTNVVTGEWIDGSIYDIIREDGDGGLVIIDEIDRSMPGFPVALNSILSQKMFLRNGRMEKLNSKAQFFVTSNTLFGATNDYTAANKQDASFINRFKVVQWDYDTDFELALVSPYGEKGKEWAKFVQKARSKAEELGITSGKLSPRQMISGAEDLAAGTKREWVESSEIWDRFSPTDRSKLRSALGK